MTISGHNIIIGQNKKIVNIKFLITCITLNKFVINFYKQ